MKHKLIYVCLFLISMGWFSCSKDERVYSCDKEVDSWVKENLTNIQKMTRNDWLKLGEDVNRAAYRAFTPKQKFIFWKEKMNEVLALDWNEAEKKHIELMYETVSVNPQWFASDFSKNEAEWEKFEQFTYRWVEIAEANFGWSKNIIGPMIASGNKMLNTRGELLLNVDSAIRLRNVAPSSYCACSTESDFCSYPYTCRDNGDCKDKSGWPACGLLLLYTCDGLCVYL